MDKEKQIVHYTSDSDFSLEISLIGLNNSVNLKTNRKNDSIEGLIKLGLEALWNIKHLEEEK